MIFSLIITVLLYDLQLACSAVPQGSQIFRFAIICCQPVADDADARGESSTLNYDTERMLENLYSSSGSAWWNLPADDSTCMMDGKRRSHQSLQNDKNWPTSMMSFVCPNCDVEGTSRYLLEYFERFHSLKKTFYEEYLSGSNNRGVSCRLDRADESVDARTGDAFLWYLMKDSRKEYLDKKQVKRPVTCSKLPPKNRVCIDPFFRSLDWNSSEIQLKNMGNVLTFLSKQQQKHKRRQKRQKSSFQLDPSYLVGMPIRLFNPIDNSYHTGRVLDFKLGAPHRIDQPIFSSNSSEASSTSPIPNIGELTDAKICSTLFLVRFRQGIEGRKISVHKWIYLEEHAVTVGGEICWANVGHQSGGAMDDRANKKVDDCKTKNGISPHVLKSDVKLHAQQYVSPYRPVQIIFRSLLEMIPVQNLNPYLSCEDITKSHTNIRGNDPCLNVLAMGFGLTFSHVRLSLKDCAGSERKTAIVAPLNDTSEESARAEVILLTPNNPSWIDQILHRAELSDEDVALELGMACMEKEEERRIRLWCNLSVSHIFKLPFNERNNAEEPV
jgi:hypothetical protein